MTTLFNQSEALSNAVENAIAASKKFDEKMGFVSTVYSMGEGGRMHQIQPTGLEIGARVYGMLGMGYSEAGTFYVYSLPDERGIQLLVEDGGQHRFDTWNIFHNDRPISRQFGIGLYWDDEEPGAIKTAEELAQMWQECDDQKKKNEREAEEKRQAIQKQREELRKEWEGVLVEISTVQGWKEKNKAEKANLLAYLRRFFPGVRFTASTADDYRPSISWTDGPSVEQVRKVANAFHISGCTRPDDYYEQFPTQFNNLFGGWSGTFQMYRNYSGEYLQELAAELVTITNKEGEHFANYTPATSEAFTFEVHGFTLCQALENNADRLHLVLCEHFEDSEDGRNLRRFLDCYGDKRTAAEVAKKVAEFADLRKPTETPNEPKGRKAAKSEPESNEAPAAGLELVEISGGVAVTGDTRTTYRNRAAIKAHGAKWNRDAQQWQATDAESVAALREWFGITAEPVASATTEPKDTATDEPKEIATDCAPTGKNCPKFYYYEREKSGFTVWAYDGVKTWADGSPRVSVVQRCKTISEVEDYTKELKGSGYIWANLDTNGNLHIIKDIDEPTDTLDLSGYDFDQITTVFNQSDYMREQPESMQNLWENNELGAIQKMCHYFEEISESFEEFLTDAANQIAMQEGDEWAQAHPLEEVRDTIRKELAVTDQPKDTDTDRVRFYVYAGYYELYISTKKLPEPYMYQATLDTFSEAGLFCECFDPDAGVICCTNARDYLPESLEDVAHLMAWVDYEEIAAA